MHEIDRDTYPVVSMRKTDMTATPTPVEATLTASTASLLLLKYCPTITVAVSLVIPTLKWHNILLRRVYLHYVTKPCDGRHMAI